GDRPHPGRRMMEARGLRPAALDEERLHEAREQQQHALALALVGDDLAGGGRERLRDRGPFGERLVVEVLEEVDRPQVGGGRRAAHASTRYWWMSETAIEPSPTALATRLIDRARTSPATKMPGTVVSSRYGSRLSGQPASCASGPARMNPRASRATTPSSQSVCGAAPMNTKQASTSMSVSAPSASRTRIRRSRPFSPSAALAVAPRRTSMFGSAAICSMR